MELISVIVPIYNVQKYINKCIQSIVDQTYRHLEILLINDESPDFSKDICEEWTIKDNRIKLINKLNGGLSDARNEGLRLAKGKYIFFIDGDDFLKNDAIQNLYNRIKKDSSDICMCNCLVVDELGNEIIERNYNKTIQDEVLTKDEMYEKLRGREGWNYVVAWNKLYKREIFDNIKFPLHKLHEDEFVIHYIINEIKKCSCISMPLYYYVQRRGSITNSSITEKSLDGIEAIIDRCEFFLKKNKHHHADITFCQVTDMLIEHYLKTDKTTRKTQQYKEIIYNFTKLYMNNFCIRIGIVNNIKSLLIIINCISQYYKLRRFTGKIVRKNRGIKNRLKFVLRLIKGNVKKRKEKKVYLLCTPIHGNLGDQAIAISEISFLSSYNVIEVNLDEYALYQNILKKFVKEKDVIMIHGGGNMGTLWPDEDDITMNIVSEYGENKIIMFPQTLYYSDNNAGVSRWKRNLKVYENHKDFTVFLRDKNSFDLYKEKFYGLKCEYVPDIVLSYNKKRKTYDRNNCLLCLRSDHEAVVDYFMRDQIERCLNEKNINFKYTDTVIFGNFKFKNRGREIEKKWHEFSCAKMIITDRLHGMIFAAITGTPCLALDNLSKKVSGVYSWISYLDYIKVCSSVQEVLENIDIFISIPEMQFNNERIEGEFDKIKKCLES